jgi:general secretion pathway protein C
MFPEGVNKYLSDPRIIFTSTLLLMAVAGYQLSLMVWKIVPQPDVGNSLIVSPRSSGQAVQAGVSSQQKVRKITSKNLYGQVQKQVNTAVVVEDAPKSSLSYKLRGIYYSDDEALASIILEKNSNTTKFYRLGDEIDHKIFIHQIQPNHVIISRLGKLEKLVLEKPELKMNKLAARNQPLRSLPTTASSQVLQSYRRRYSNNPMALARRFQAIPVQENGQNIGYKLKALRGEQLLKKLNLQDDDVFVAINGIGLDKPFQALDALKSLTTAKDVSLTVLRNGNRETLDFNL